MSETIKFEKSSGNVFLDIGFSKEEAERELLRSDLAIETYRILEARKLTQTTAGEILGISQSDVSRLKNGDFHRFSVERLSTFLNRLSFKLDSHRTSASFQLNEIATVGGYLAPTVVGASSTITNRCCRDSRKR